jgi:hypothetical protein
MKSLQNHGPVLLLLVVLVFAIFGELTTTPLWDGLDAQIICDAHTLARDPSPMFDHVGFYFSQPLLQLAFLAEYKLFGLDVRGYLTVNLAVHAFNAFIVYMLVNMLFPRKKMAVLAAALFAVGVGSYGRVFMTLQQLEGLLMASLHLLVLYFFIRNDFRHGGRVLSPMFIAGLALFLLSGLTRNASFSLVGCLIAYKAFFYQHRRRSILSADILVFVIVAVLFYLAQSHWGYRQPTVFAAASDDHYFSLLSVKNVFRYLTLMFFPMQQSPALETAPQWIVWLFHARTWIRLFLALSIISYSFFGFLFGSSAIRFFIAWTYITLLPFTSHSDTGQWLNLSQLYLTSLGFCVVLAAGANGCAGLLARKGWQKATPYLVPLMFAAASVTVAHSLDAKNKVLAARPSAVELRDSVTASCRPALKAPPRP